MVATKVKGFLEETVFLDPFQSSFRPNYRMEIASDDNLRKDIDRETASLSIILDLSEVFRYHRTSYLSGAPVWTLEMGGIFLQQFHSFLLDKSRKCYFSPWTLMFHRNKCYSPCCSTTTRNHWVRSSELGHKVISVLMTTQLYLALPTGSQEGSGKHEPAPVGGSGRDEGQQAET